MKCYKSCVQYIVFGSTAFLAHCFLDKISILHYTTVESYYLLPIALLPSRCGEHQKYYADDVFLSLTFLHQNFHTMICKCSEIDFLLSLACTFASTPNKKCQQLCRVRQPPYCTHVPPDSNSTVNAICWTIDLYFDPEDGTCSQFIKS